MRSEAKNKPEQLNSYHFSGSGEYEPIMIEAASLPEAEKIWEKKRKLINLN